LELVVVMYGLTDAPPEDEPLEEPLGEPLDPEPLGVVLDPELAAPPLEPDAAVADDFGVPPSSPVETLPAEDDPHAAQRRNESGKSQLRSNGEFSHGARAVASAAEIRLPRMHPDRRPRPKRRKLTPTRESFQQHGKFATSRDRRPQSRKTK
jgi:hypothetical protein